MYKEKMWIKDYQVEVEYSLVEADPEVGVTGGVCIEDFRILGKRFGHPNVDIDTLRDAAALEIHNDLFEDNRY